MRRWVILLGTMLALTACNFGGTTSGTTATTGPISAGATLAAPTSVNTLAPTPTTGSVSATINPSISGNRVLAWNPNTGQIAWYGNNQSKLKDGITSGYVFPCGMSSNPDKIVIFDNTSISLYPSDGSAPQSLGDATGLSCINSHIQFSPDGNRLGILKYSDIKTGAIYATGTLHILKTSDWSEATTINNVASFDLENDGVLAVQFFTPTDKPDLANSADLIWWDGSSNKTINTQDITPLQDCQFAQARPMKTGDKIYTLLGEKCKSNSIWRIISTNMGDGTSVILGTPTDLGKKAFLATASQSDLWRMPDSNQLLVSSPNGLDADVVDISRVSLSDGKVTPVLQSVTTDRFPPSAQVGGFHYFTPAPKGSLVAMVTRGGNGEEKLFVYDLNKPDDKPVQVAGSATSDRINGLAWNGNGDQLYFSVTGDNPGLFMWKQGSTDNKRIARGTFRAQDRAHDALVVNQDGSLIAVPQENAVSATDLRYNLVVITTADGSISPLVQGDKKQDALVPLAIR